MKFAPLPLDQAEGKILGHNVSGPEGRRLLRKGKPLSSEEISLLKRLGRKSVYVAELEDGDVDENTAAERVARVVGDQNMRFSGPAYGRVNLYAQAAGLLRVDVDRLSQLNSQEGITVATLANHSAVGEGKLVATVKIPPYAIPESAIRAAETVTSDNQPILSLDRFRQRRVGLILSGSPAVRERIVHGFEKSLSRRLEDLGSSVTSVDYIPLEDEQDEISLAETINRQVREGIDLIILAGETAIMDSGDLAPRAVKRSGGFVVCYGAPVDPGNLLMLAYHGSVPIMGAPGCARSPKLNIVDLLLPRLLVGDHLTARDVHDLGHGGLLEDAPERPLPRSLLP